MGGGRWAKEDERWAKEDGRWAMGDGLWALFPSERGTDEKDVMVVLVIVVCWTRKWKDPQSSPRQGVNEKRERLLSLLFCGRIERKREKKWHRRLVYEKENGYVILTIVLPVSCCIERKGEKRNGIIAVSMKKRLNTSSCRSLLPFLVAMSCSAYRLNILCMTSKIARVAERVFKDAHMVAFRWVWVAAGSFAFVALIASLCRCFCKIRRGSSIGKLMRRWRGRRSCMERRRRGRGKSCSSQGRSLLSQAAQTIRTPVNIRSCSSSRSIAFL